MKFEIRNEEKIVITGFNGIGKSTLLKTLIGEIKPIAGEYKFSEAIKSIGYYEQELNWENKEETPMNIIWKKYPKLNQKQIRKYLASCGIKKDHVLKPISTLSGGEQSKVKLCNLILKPCNMLILDEPTNHLDEDTKEVLKKAIKEYKGTVILVSHEEAFYKDLKARIINIKDLCI